MEEGGSDLAMGLENLISNFEGGGEWVGTNPILYFFHVIMCVYIFLYYSDLVFFENWRRV